MRKYPPALGRTYAFSLLAVSKDEEIDIFLEALKIIGASLENEIFRDQFFNPNLNKKIKIDILMALLKGHNIENLTLKDYFKVVMQNNREKLFIDLWKKYENYSFIKARVLKAIVFTPYKLDEELKMTISEKLKKKTKKRIVIEERIDKDLIAGAKIFVEDRILDLSVSGKLVEITSKLLEE